MEVWKQFLPAGLAVQETASKGKGLFTSEKKFKAGDVVLEASPIALVVSKTEREEYCHYCLKGKSSCNAGLMRCTQCKFIYYCSRQCQKQDWLLHKQECVGIARISPNLPTDSMRLLLRCLLVYYDRMKSQKFISTDSDVKWEFDLLCSYVDDTKLGSCSYMLKGVHLLLGEPLDFGFSFAMDIFYKISCNTFTVYDGELRSIGAAIYFIPSLLNHSCWPNCTVCYNGHTLSIRMLEDITDDQELLISYVDPLETRQARREGLMHPYGFKCLCSRCFNDSQDSLDALMESYACPNCSHPVLPSHKIGCSYNDCPSHGIEDINLAEETIQFACHRLQEMLNYRKQQKWESMKRLCNESLSKQKKMLYKLNIATVKTLEYGMDACIETQCWQDAVDCGEVLTEAYSKYLPANYPVRGLHLMKVGKIQLLINGQTREAIGRLCQAKKQLIISHGSAHPLITTTDRLIAEGRLTLEPLLHVES